MSYAQGTTIGKGHVTLNFCNYNSPDMFNPDYAIVEIPLPSGYQYSGHSFPFRHDVLSISPLKLKIYKKIGALKIFMFDTIEFGYPAGPLVVEIYTDKKSAFGGTMTYYGELHWTVADATLYYKHWFPGQLK